MQLQFSNQVVCRCKAENCTRAFSIVNLTKFYEGNLDANKVDQLVTEDFHVYQFSETTNNYFVMKSDQTYLGVQFRGRHDDPCYKHKITPMTALCVPQYATTRYVQIM